MADLKLAVTEACTNCDRARATPGGGGEEIVVRLAVDACLLVEVQDWGSVSTPIDGEVDHAGVGLMLIRSLTDELTVTSSLREPRGFAKRLESRSETRDARRGAVRDREGSRHSGRGMARNGAEVLVGALDLERHEEARRGPRGDPASTPCPCTSFLPTGSSRSSGRAADCPSVSLKSTLPVGHRLDGERERELGRRLGRRSP